MREADGVSFCGVAVLKKVLIGLAVVIVLAGAAAGVEAYRLYSAAQGIFTGQNPTGTPCLTPTIPGYSTYPKLLPWTSASTSTSGPHASPTTTTGQKLAVCVPVTTDPTLSDKSRINILLLGTDNDCKFQSTILTQTVFVVTIDPVHKKVGMLSIPRDSWLPVPGYSVVGDPYTYHKMDEAFSLGESAAGTNNPNAEFLSGVKYAEDTIYQNFGITINYYGWVGLNGFVKVINTLGGVNINAIHPIVDDSYPGDLQHDCYGFTRVYIPSGPQYMNGLTALQYVRSRHADLIGDYGRGQRQLQLIEALRPKIDSLGLTDFITVQNLFNELQGYVKSSLSVGQIGSYISFGKNLNPNQIHKLVLTPPYYSSTGTQSTPNGVTDTVNLNWSTVQPAVQKMFAPIPTGSKKPVHHGPTFVTAAEAASYLLRVSGATTQPAAQSTRTYSGPLRGSVYFVDKGNVWRYSSSGTQQVTNTTAINSASITSNGHKLVYYRRWSQDNADVWVKNLTTGKTKQITFGRQGNGNIANASQCLPDAPLCGYVWNVNPAVSPNGRTIIYSSDAYKDIYSPTLTLNADCPLASAPANGGIDPALYAYSVTTGLAAQATAPCNGAGGDTDARFDPANPNLVVYTEYYYLPSSKVASRLVVLNLQTGHRWRITPYSGSNMQAVWSSNGRDMAWVGSSSQSTTLYVAPYNAGRIGLKARRTVDTGLISEPEFSPDGKHLIYFKLVGDSFQVWIVDLRNGLPSGSPMLLMSKPNLTTTSPLVWIK